MEVRPPAQSSRPASPPAELWLALGVLIAPHRQAPPFRTQSFASATGATLSDSSSAMPIRTIEWRYVVGYEGERLSKNETTWYRMDPRYVFVDCADGGFELISGKSAIDERTQWVCFCKVTRWFSKALLLFPTARYIGKAEDDTIIHDARLIFELSALAVEWYGLFHWAVQRGRHDQFCSDADHELGRNRPFQCFREETDDYPFLFASGALDVRSRTLVQKIASCKRHQAMLRKSVHTLRGACDSLSGRLVNRCLHGQNISIGHLTWSKFARKLQYHGTDVDKAVRQHAVVLHGVKSVLRNGSPHIVNWDYGPAMMPLQLTINTTGGALGRVPTWHALNATAIRTYKRHPDFKQTPSPQIACALIKCQRVPVERFSSTQVGALSTPRSHAPRVRSADE